MAKILLVEDDTNLREIFEMRLQAEGYETSVASNGEEALVTAMREKPELVIADVMMPKMSGFEMVENLRASPDMAKVKVIMMTALGQDEDRARGDKLGVVKYLVKSQVTLEDFVQTVKEVIGGSQGTASTATTTPAQNNTTNNNLGGDKNMDDNNQQANPAPADPAAGGGAAPAGDANPISGAPAGDGQMSSAQAQDSVNQQVNDAMGGAAAPAGGNAPAGGDASGTPADVPMGTPPADQPAGGDSGAGTPPAGDQGAPGAGPTPGGV